MRFAARLGLVENGEGPSKKKNRFISRAMMAALILACCFTGKAVISELMFIVWDRLPELTVEKPRKNRTLLAVVDFHTSAATVQRLEGFTKKVANNSHIVKRRLLFRSAISKDARVTPTGNVVKLPCNDERNGEGGLACRVQSAYENFLTEFPDCGWYYKAMDDTWIAVDKFYDWVCTMDAMFNPRKHIVIMSHANHEHKTQFFLHGGAGWLMSRALIEYQVKHNISILRLLPYSKYIQDDTSQSIIARRIYDRPSYWDEMLISGFDCRTCEAKGALDNWEELPICPDEVVGAPVNDIIAQHAFGYRDSMRAFIDKIGSFPDHILFYRVPLEQKLYLCRGHNRVRMWGNSMRRRVRLTEKDLPKPLINWSTLKKDAA